MQLEFTMVHIWHQMAVYSFAALSYTLVATEQIPSAVVQEHE